ncbi:UDP-N-acetylglucosamine 2-epimerase [Epilithonimonas sp.]|uniref:UDP-N-acetylglucosamine 2-epimerase n=1 Tax=Epilithonimonas sp. TaxID=2894511 RepID=UPI0035B4C915
MNKLKSLKFFFNNIIVTPVIISKIILGQKSSQINEISTVSKITFFLRGFKNLTYILFGFVKKIDVLFLTSNHYEVLEDNVVYDKFVTSFANYVKNKNKTYKIARYTNDFIIPKNYFSKKDLINLQEVGVLYSKLQQNGDFISSSSLTSDFLECLKDLELSKDVNPLDPTYLLKFIRQKDIFKIYLRKSKVKHIVVVCYYDLKSFAIIHAANELNIPVIDLQHGVQGKGHFAYNYWPKELVQASKLFPTHFWCWDKWSADVIKSWFPEKNNVIVGSNVWMKERIKPKPKVLITFTAQPQEDAIPAILIQAIRKYKGKLKWCIRLHPHQLNELEKYKELLKKNQILDLIEFEKSTYMPLSELLNMSYIHITDYSSVILEAMWFGIPSVVISELGKRHYKEQVPENMLISAYSADSIIEAIQNLESKWVFDELHNEKKEDFEELANKFFRYDG